MIRSRKHQFIISFILACVCATAVGAEPNEAKTDLIFEINNKKTQPWIANSDGRGAIGPIKPKHVAVFYIRKPNRLFTGSEAIFNILKTYIGKSLSEQQRKFLTGSDALVWWGIKDIANHDMVQLYAVSEEDVKKTVQAYLEAATNEVKANEQTWKNLLREAEEKIAKAKKELPDKEVQAKAAKVNYQNMKKQFHKLFRDSDAVEEAKQTILEMNRNLNTLNIEIKGIEAKLSAVKEYKSKKNISIEGLAKLEQILSEQTIELAGTLARKEAAIQIRTIEEKFYESYTEMFRLDCEVINLRDDLRNCELDIFRAKERLARPTPEMLQPEVYQNKVTIYPVLAE